MTLSIIVGTADPIYKTTDAKLDVVRKADKDYCRLITECDYVFSVSVTKDGDVGVSYFRDSRTYSVSIRNNAYVSIGVSKNALGL